MKRIFDGHLDLSWNALSWDRDITLELDLLNQAERGLTDHPARGRATTTLPEMRRGGVAVCQATLLARGRSGRSIHGGNSRLSLDFANQEIASATARGQLAYYELLERRGLLRMIRTAGDLDAHWASWADESALAPIGYILAMEGADPIVDVGHAAAWWELGLRSVNLAHYGKSRYAVGTGDDGPLTPDGVQLLKEFEQLGMILDVTHLSDTSFFQALDLFSGPGAGQSQQLPGAGSRRPAVQRRADQAPDRARGRHRRGPRRLDARPRLDPGRDHARGRRPRERSPTTSTTSASSPATRGTRPSAATWTAASAPSRRPLGLDRISDLQKLERNPRAAGAIRPRRSTTSSTATGCGSSASTCRAESGEAVFRGWRR